MPFGRRLPGPARLGLTIERLLGYQGHMPFVPLMERPRVRQALAMPAALSPREPWWLTWCFGAFYLAVGVLLFVFAAGNSDRVFGLLLMLVAVFSLRSDLKESRHLARRLEVARAGAEYAGLVALRTPRGRWGKTAVAGVVSVTTDAISWSPLHPPKGERYPEPFTLDREEIAGEELQEIGRRRWEFDVTGHDGVRRQFLTRDGPNLRHALDPESAPTR